MEDLNCSGRFGYPRFPFPWPPFPFPFPDQFPPYLLTISPTFGVVHNTLLTDFAAAFPALNASDEDIWSFMTRGTTKSLAETGITGGKFISFKDADNYVTNIESKLDKYLSTLVKEGTMTPFIADQTQIILNIIKNNPTSADVFAMISAFSSRLAFRTDVSQDDKIILTGAGAIAQSSSYFWDSALKNPNDPWHQKAVNLNNGGNLFKIKWADVIGFVIGAVAGSGGGPVGSVTTGIALGGFASSAFGESA